MLCCRILFFVFYIVCVLTMVLFIKAIKGGNIQGGEYVLQALWL